MKTTSASPLVAFRWSYIILPLIFLLLSVILVAVFYARLPFQVAYHFQSDGSPDAWLIKPLVFFWALVPQVLLTLGGAVVTLVFSGVLNRFLEPESAAIKPQRILFIMGNIVAIPQLILDFAMLDIFSYNSYQTHLRPSVLVLSLIVIVVGGIILGVFFVQAVKRVWLSNKK